MKFTLSSVLARLSAQSAQNAVPPKRMQSDTPRTLAATEAASDAARPRVFDPALKHYGRAFVLGEQASVSAHERLEWERSRAEVRAHLFSLVASSAWRDHLILRGSVLMRHWFGETARDPKDIDWVFTPPDVKLGDSVCQACLDDLIALVKSSPRTENAQILADHIAWDNIWTYERAAGRRLVFPFALDGGAQREIQMDIVWGETMPEPPVLTSIATANGSLELLAATPETSLAWKLLWLAGDMHPQGKDLYDAVLLAESYSVRPALLREVFDADQYFHNNVITLQTFREIFDVDWANFLIDYPWVEGTVDEWQNRFLSALAPTLA